MAEEQKIALDTESPAKVSAIAPAEVPTPAPAEVPTPSPAEVPTPAPVPADVTKDVTEEKIQNPPPEHISDDSKALAVVKKIEEQLEKKKAEYAERMKNKVAAIHKEAEERRAMIEAKRGEDILKAEETAAKYRATGFVPKATCGCF